MRFENDPTDGLVVRLYDVAGGGASLLGSLIVDFNQGQSPSPLDRFRVRIRRQEVSGIDYLLLEAEPSPELVAPSDDITDDPPRRIVVADFPSLMLPDPGGEPGSVQFGNLVQTGTYVSQWERIHINLTDDPTTLLPYWTDFDGDGIVDNDFPGACAGGATAGCNDNCVLIANPGQDDLDGDGVGDLCDLDADGDGIDDSGNPGVCSGGQTAGCDDNCLMLANAGQDDLDDDGLGDACDPDADGDGVEGPVGLNEDSNDLDPNVCRDTENGVGDGCDDCSSGSDDPNSDGPDADGDGLCDSGDVPAGENPDVEEAGCGCRLVASPRSTDGLAWWLLLALTCVVRLRQRANRLLPCSTNDKPPS